MRITSAHTFCTHTDLQSVHCTHCCDDLFHDFLNKMFYLLHFFRSYFRRPTNLSIVWTRRSRRVASMPLLWEPDMVNPLVGHILWPVPDNHTISVTLFKDPRTHELEDKDWTFVIEDVSILSLFRRNLCVYLLAL